MAPPRTHSPPRSADGSPPRAAVSRQSALARAGTTPHGARAAPSDLECGADPCQGWPGSAITPHHPTPAPPLCTAALAQTASPLLARPAPHGAGEAGGPSAHRGEAMAGPGTAGVGTPEHTPDADQSHDSQADETCDAAGPDAASAAAPLALLCTSSPA